MAKNLIGQWTNGDCTEVTIEEPERGKLTDQYKIAVRMSTEASVPLMGLVNYTKADCLSFSFCVSMGANGGDTCNAVGQYFKHNGEEVLKMLWLMCAGVDSHNDNWGATRFCEVLATNEFLPWELVCAFKQILWEFLVREEQGSLRHLPPPRTRLRSLISPPRPAPTPSASSTDYQLSDSPPRETSSPPPGAEGGEGHREEIPTISSDVNHHLSTVCPYAVHRDWGLPYCHSFPCECPGAYGTTL